VVAPRRGPGRPLDAHEPCGGDGARDLRPALLAPALPDAVRYGKEVVFDICTALAGAEDLLRRSGRLEEAGRVARLFDVVESGLVGPPARR
jgi:hypothetical protein